MGRKLREPSPTGYYHWITRGIHRKAIFHERYDFHVFLCLVNEFRCQFDITIHHYCIMDNHVHLLLYADNPLRISSFSRDIQRRYALYYSGKYHWIGRTFQDRYKSLPIIEESHLLACARYIERNPIQAKKVTCAEDYPYSSFRAYLKGYDYYGLLEPTDTYLGIAETEVQRIKAYTEYVNEPQEYDSEDLQNILVE
jgi:putative transposase